MISANRHTPGRSGRQSDHAVALTQREHEVLQWLCAGKSKPEIAIIMGISPWTVKIHVANIYRKLDVGNRGQAVVQAIARGLIDIT